MHWPALRRINALDSHLRRVLGIPIHCGRDVLQDALGRRCSLRSLIF